MVSEERVLEALTEVVDPELGLDFVALGLIYAVAIDGDHVTVTYTLTTPACPYGPVVAARIAQVVMALDGVVEVTPDLAWLPIWTPEMMDDDAKFALGY